MCVALSQLARRSIPSYKEQHCQIAGHTANKIEKPETNTCGWSTLPQGGWGVREEGLAQTLRSSPHSDVREQSSCMSLRQSKPGFPDSPRETLLQRRCVAPPDGWPHCKPNSGQQSKLAAGVWSQKVPDGTLQRQVCGSFPMSTSELST